MCRSKINNRRLWSGAMMQWGWSSRLKVTASHLVGGGEMISLKLDGGSKGFFGPSLSRLERLT